MNLLREYIRELLKEDAMGFVHQLAAGTVPEDFFGGKIDKQRGREIKQAFAKHADHQWLSTIDTVHWASSPYALKALVGKGKDELSATMALPGDPLRSIGAFVPYGLWVKGRITLASDNQDTIYSGFYGDYGVGHEGSEEEVAHRDKSSGRNKRPTMSKSYKNYGKLERGNEYMEKMARNIPYVLDQSTWNPNNPSSTNEALVDNWRPVGIVVSESDVVEAVKAASKKLVTGGHSPPSGNTAKDIDYFLVGAVKEAFLTALELGVPIVDISRNELWNPSKGELNNDK